MALRLAIGAERELDLLINALRSKTNVQLMEAPTLLVVDGTEAQIKVGAEVPVTTASFGDPVLGGGSLRRIKVPFVKTPVHQSLQLWGQTSKHGE